MLIVSSLQNKNIKKPQLHTASLWHTFMGKILTMIFNC